MAVSKQQLAEYVGELGLPQEQADGLIANLMSNEQAATQFVGQRMRHSDYTKKTTELATTQAQVTAQVQEYAQRVQTADALLQDVNKKLENETISRATAQAQLHRIKSTYNLTDEDLGITPGTLAPITTPAAGGGLTEADLQKRMDTFKTGLLSELMPEFRAMSRITAIQNDITQNHFELTGKRISQAEMTELLETAETKKLRLTDAWEQKYNIPTIRQEKHDEANKTKWQLEWETENKRKISEAAMSGIRPNVDSTPNQNAVLGRQYKQAEPMPGHTSTPPPTAPVDRLSGAERAAAKFVARRQQGIAMGAPAPAA